MQEKNVYYQRELWVKGPCRSIGSAKKCMRRLVESGIPDKLLKDFTDPKRTQEGIYKPTDLQHEHR